MSALKTQVKNGRIFIDEPTTLPEGTIVEFNPRPPAETPKQMVWEEIKSLYPDEWVILVDLLYTEPKEPNVLKEVCGGVVFAHSKQRDALLKSTKDALVGQMRAFFFTGPMKGHLLRWAK